MSSKSRKASQAVAGPSRSSPHKSQTPQPKEAGGKSPLSPTKYSRLHEKEELANLNDRLACYIDRVRTLESENSRLTREVKTSQEHVTREVTSVKSIYENELSEARKLLDELSKEKAKLQIDTRRLYSENEELRNDLDKKNKDFNVVQSSLSIAENRLSDISAKLSQLQSDKKKLNDENKALEQERKKLAQLLADARKQLEEETLQRVDMENSLQTMREDIAFKEQLHEQQLHETRSKRQVEISEIDGRLSQEYEEKLYQSLQEIRDQYEYDLENNKSEIKRLYEEKIRSLSSQLSRSGNAASLAMNEMRLMQSKIDDLNKAIQDLENEKTAAMHKARDLERIHEQSKASYIDEFSKQEQEITNLRDQMAQQVQEYQDLMDIKVALDLEIAAYRKLLEGEEARLNITPMVSPTGRGTPRKMLKGKRKRTFIEESDESEISNFSVTTSSKCDISISEVDGEGKFVKLTNKGNKELGLGGWQVSRKVGDESTVYKFHRTLKAEPGATITIWSANAEKTHEPPENLVMKGQRWVIGDSMVTTLLNNSGEEMAVAEHKKQQAADKSVKRQREGSSFYSKRSFLSSSYRASSERPAEERCVVM